MTQFPTTAKEAHEAMTQATEDQNTYLGKVYKAATVIAERELTDRELAEEVAWAQDRLAITQQTIELLRAEVQRRIEAAGGRQLAVEGFTVALVSDSPTYDYDRLIALREALEPDDWDKVHKDAYEKMTKVPAKFDGTQLRKVERDFGGHVREIIEAARIPGRSHVVVERR